MFWRFSANWVIELRPCFATPQAALANDGVRPLRIGGVDLAPHAVSVEYGIGDIARGKAVSGPIDTDDPLLRPFRLACRQIAIKGIVGMSAGAQHDGIKGELFGIVTAALSLRLPELMHPYQQGWLILAPLLSD